MRDLIDRTLFWAQQRNLLAEGSPDRQALKMVSEVGEFVDEVLKTNIPNAKMEMGDVLVTCILTAAKMNFDIEECLELALNKIEQRTGKTVNGVFVKD